MLGGATRRPQAPKRRSGAPSHGWRAPCPDTPEKTPYRSRVSAERAIVKAQEMAAPGEDVPVRAYECPGCSLWHLSKLERWEPPGSQVVEEELTVGFVTYPVDREWRPFRDHTNDGEYAQWPSGRDGVARYHSTREGGYHWYEVVYDDPDKNGDEPCYLPEYHVELLERQ